MRWRHRRGSHRVERPAAQRSTRSGSWRRCVAMLRCRPARRSRVSIRLWDSRRPRSGVGATASTASASRLGEVGAERGQRGRVVLPQQRPQLFTCRTRDQIIV